MSQSSTAFIPLLLGAVADQKAGRLQTAADGFAAVLSLEPEQPQALLFGGVVALRLGRVESAVDLLARAVAARPTVAECHVAYGNALWAARRRSEARRAWQGAIRWEPAHLGALLNLASAQEASGETEMAVLNCRAAVDAHPAVREGWAALSSALRADGRPDDALAAADAALRLDPDFAPAHHGRGMALKALGRLEEAAAALQAALACDPTASGTHLNLANLLHDLDDLPGALSHCRTALAFDPAAAEAEAVLSFLCIQAGDLPAAIAAGKRAIGLGPELPEAHCNLGIALLTSGDLPGGFAEYEWRKRHPRYREEYGVAAGAEWTGQDLRGRSIVILAEQGLGDAIMFARYARLLADRGATVTLACDRRLLELLRTAPGVDSVLPKTRSLPRFDFFVDQMSLPLHLRTTLATVPAPRAYLSADPERVQRWAERLGRSEGRRRIGIAWAGNQLHTNDRNRSCPPAALARIVGMPGIEAVSVQVGPGAATGAAALGLRDWSPELVDFAETAALLHSLDLVVTVDTSVAHVAAALGLPTSILLPHCPEWRWLQDRADSPWYPTVELFRQPRPGDWDSPVAAVCARLSASAAAPVPAGR